MSTIPSVSEPRIYFTESQLAMNAKHVERYVARDGMSPEQAEIRLLKGQVKALQVQLAVDAVRRDIAQKGTQHIEGDNDWNDGGGTRMPCPVCFGTLTYKVKLDGGINGVCLTAKCVCFSVTQ